MLALAGGAPREVTALFAALALFRAPYTLGGGAGLRAHGSGHGPGGRRARRRRCSRLHARHGGRHGGRRRARAAVGALAGPALLRLVFGADATLDAGACALVATGSAFAVGGLVLTVVVMAQDRAPRIALAWAVALLPGVAAYVLVDGDLDAVVAAFVVVEVVAWAPARARGATAQGLTAATSTDEPNGRSRRARSRRLGRAQPAAAPAPLAATRRAAGRRRTAADPAQQRVRRRTSGTPARRRTSTARPAARRSPAPPRSAAACSAGGDRPGRRGRTRPTGRPARRRAAARPGRAPAPARPPPADSGSQCSMTSKAATTSNVASANGSARADAHTPRPGPARAGRGRRRPAGGRRAATSALGASALPTSRTRRGSPSQPPSPASSRRRPGREPPVVGTLHRRGTGLDDLGHRRPWTDAHERLDDAVAVLGGELVVERQPQQPPAHVAAHRALGGTRREPQATVGVVQGHVVEGGADALGLEVGHHGAPHLGVRQQHVEEVVGRHAVVGDVRQPEAELARRTA